MRAKIDWKDILLWKVTTVAAIALVASGAVWLISKMEQQDRPHRDALALVRRKDLRQVEPFLDFLNRWPYDDEHDKVLGRLRSLLETECHVRIEVLRDESSGADMKTLPFEEDAVKLCAYAKVRGVSFVVSSHGTALSASYRSRYKGLAGALGSSQPHEVATGAQISGFIEVKGVNDSEPKQVSFAGVREPPARVEHTPGSNTARSAFYSAYTVSFLPTFVAVLVNLSGDSKALIPGLRDEAAAVRSAVANVIGDRRGPGTVGALIQALHENEEERTNEAVIQALRGVTGKEFGRTCVPGALGGVKRETRSITRAAMTAIADRARARRAEQLPAGLAAHGGDLRFGRFRHHAVLRVCLLAAA